MANRPDCNDLAYEREKCRVVQNMLYFLLALNNGSLSPVHFHNLEPSIKDFREQYDARHNNS